MTDIIKIAIIDDHKIFRAGMELILNGFDNVKVVVSLENGNDLAKMMKNVSVDLIFMDIRLPGKDGIELTREALKKNPEIAVVGLTMYSEIEYFNKMIEAGARGFLLKNTKEDELERAINTVMEGNMYVSSEFHPYLDPSLLEKITGKPPKIQLTEREQEVLECIAQGLSNHEIADKMFLSIHTVDGYRRNLFTKTGVKNSASLIMYAVKQGLLKP